MGQGQQDVLPLAASTLVEAHSAQVGGTGSGKTGFLIGRVMTLLSCLPGRVHVCVLDGKGEAARDLLGTFAPAIAHESWGLKADQIGVCSPWKDGCHVGLNLLARQPGMPVDVQASQASRAIQRLVGDNFGQRMAPMIMMVLRAVIELKGSLHDVLRILEDDEIGIAVGRRVRDPDVRRYLIEVLPREPAATKAALRARLVGLLGLRAMRAMLCSRESITGVDFINSRLSIIDLGGAPPGHADLSMWLGTWIFNIITSAILNRPDEPGRPQLCLFVDEFHHLIHSHADLEQLLTMARWKDTSVHLTTQSLAQVQNQRLIQTALANIGMFVAFRPRPEDLHHFGHLISGRGHVVDPELPDRLLEPSRQTQLWTTRLRALPPRYAWLVDLSQGGESHIIRSLELPYQRARQISERLSAEQRHAFWRGKFGKTVEELESDAATALKGIQKPGAGQQGDMLDGLGSGGSGRRAGRGKGKKSPTFMMELPE